MDALASIISGGLVAFAVLLCAPLAADLAAAARKLLRRPV
jgi:hypothetical protein